MHLHTNLQLTILINNSNKMKNLKYFMSTSRSNTFLSLNHENCIAVELLSQTFNGLYCFLQSLIGGEDFDILPT